MGEGRGSGGWLSNSSVAPFHGGGRSYSALPLSVHSKMAFMVGFVLDCCRCLTLDAQLVLVLSVFVGKYDLSLLHFLATSLISLFFISILSFGFIWAQMPISCFRQDIALQALLLCLICAWFMIVFLERGASVVLGS